MIIPDHEIRALLSEGKIGIEPLDDSQIKSACVDLSLGSEFRVFKHTHESCIDSMMPKDYTERVVMENSRFILHPREFVLGITNETVSLPADITGYVDGKSSLGRLGVTAHITSGWIDPGFSGRLVLEISNLGKMPVALYCGMKICKIMFFTMTSASEVPYNMRPDSKYLEQNSVEQSKIHEDIK